MLNSGDLWRLVRRERELRDIKQDEMAAAVGLSRSFYSRVERGGPGSKTFNHLAKALRHLNMVHLLSAPEIQESTSSLMERIRKHAALYAVIQDPRRINQYSEDDLETVNALLGAIERRLEKKKGHGKKG